MERRYYAYILASDRNGTLYVGMTNNLALRVHQHRQGRIPGFTQTYGVKRLVWYEISPRPVTPSPPKSASSAGGERGSWNGSKR